MCHMTNFIYKNDLPDILDLGPIIAIDTETMGLNLNRDRLCVVQLSSGDGHAHIIQIDPGNTTAPNLCRILSNPKQTKLFHFARFDIAVLQNHFGVITFPIYCTKIASKLIRTYSDRHGLKNLLSEMLSIDISKHQQSSDWGAKKLTTAQINYAASDVLYLHQLMEKLDVNLKREGRTEIAKACFDFLPSRATLDLAGWPDHDIFSHS